MIAKTYFVKTEDFRTIHAVGVFGGVFTRNGGINMSFFTERPPLPKSVELEVDEATGDIVSQKISEDSKDGIIREVSCSVNMDLDTAKKVSTWLINQITAFESQMINQ